ncbi:hypothetical protein SEPCBS57363_000231 [Sporothrix epigloea]|uniref:ABC transporter domain-containing protein n=1 Tax=Sporothrix epigloea TaxID=1892477 RepID=A0ABP0D3L3_9PEZI
MTSSISDSVAAIQVSCKQTRFQIESPNYRELDIDGLNITVTASLPAGATKAKAKAASRSTGLEILTDATLRLKAGERYALVGRNGTGKSTILRAIAEKLIPGIPEETRIAILQQTNDGADGALAAANRRTVLEEVIERATAKDELEQEILTLSQGMDTTAADDSSSDAYATLRALRKLRLERLQKRLFVLDKNARLRSGARGMQARKALTALEKTVAEATASWQQDDSDITAEMLHAETQEAADLLADLQIQAEPARLAHIESRAKNILKGLGFSEVMATTKAVGDLSGGWRMRTALAAALLSDADILLLDEPTNFLDMLGILWLQKFLLASSERTRSDDTTSGEPGRPPPTIVLVSHDRDFVSAVACHLILLQDKAVTYYTGDLPSYEAAQAESRQHLHKLKDAQDRQRAHLQETIVRNMREGKKNNDDTRIRQAKMRQKKLDDRWGLETNAKGHRFKLNRDMAGFHHTRRAEIEVPPEARAVHISLPDPPDLRFPGALISLEGVCFRFGAEKKTRLPPPPWTLDTINLNVHEGDRIGIVGLNGAGKSTLIRLLVGDDAVTASGQVQSSTRPIKSTVTMHPRLRLAYYAQDAVDAIRALGGDSDSSRDDDAPLTALGLLTRDVDGKLQEGDLRALLGELGLPGRLASDTPLRRLSGGQLVRCALARLLWQRPQCLVLDEVTTHLDYETNTALRRALRTWPGAVILVSHDRWFMRGVIEGAVDDEAGSSSGDDGNGSDLDDGIGKGLGGRNLVYRLRAGKLTLLQGGLQEFEDQLEKRVEKLLQL